MKLKKDNFVSRHVDKVKDAIKIKKNASADGDEAYSKPVAIDEYVAFAGYNPNRICQLAERAEDTWLTTEVMSSNGLVVCSNGMIGETGHASTAGSYPGVAFNINPNDGSMDFSPAIMTNTINCGPRFITHDEKDRAIDMGPVDVPIVIGTAYNPYGIYIPLFSLDAVQLGAEVLSDYYNLLSKQFESGNEPNSFGISSFIDAADITEARNMKLYPAIECKASDSDE